MARWVRLCVGFFRVCRSPDEDYVDSKRGIECGNGDDRRWWWWYTKQQQVNVPLPVVYGSSAFTRVSHRLIMHRIFRGKMCLFSIGATSKQQAELTQMAHMRQTKLILAAFFERKFCVSELSTKCRIYSVVRKPVCCRALFLSVFCFFFFFLLQTFFFSFGLCDVGWTHRFADAYDSL